MKDIKLLMRKKDELLAKRQSILDKAVEENRGYTEEERNEVQALATQVHDLDEQITESQEIERQRSGIPSGQAKPSQQSGDPEPSVAKFRNLGEFVRDIALARRGIRSEAIVAHEERMNQQLRAMNISDGSSLGFLIPDTFESGVAQLSGAGGWVRNRARVIPAGEFPDGKFKKRVARQGAAGVYNGILVNRIGEGIAPIDESKLQYDLFTLDPSDKKVGLFYITSQEALNNPTAVTSDMQASFNGALAETQDDDFVNGNGVGVPEGILVSKGALDVDRDTSDDFKFADVVAMRKRLYPRAPNPNWELSLDLYDKVALMVDGANRYIMIAGDATKGIPDILHGRPIHWSEINPVTGERGDAILADWSFYYIKDGSGPFFSVDPFTRFLEDEIRVKMIVKYDGGTWVREPLKLRNGLVVSPFVVLK